MAHGKQGVTHPAAFTRSAVDVSQGDPVGHALLASFPNPQVAHGKSSVSHSDVSQGDPVGYALLATVRNKDLGRERQQLAQVRPTLLPCAGCPSCQCARGHREGQLWAARLACIEAQSQQEG